MRIRSMLPLPLAVALLLPLIAVAATGDTLDASSSSSSSSSSEGTTSSAGSAIPAGVGDITIDQSSPKGIVGTWTLLRADAESTNGGGANTVLRNMPTGRYTILVTPPNGASTAVRVYEGASQVVYQPYQQASFSLYPDQQLHVTVNFQYTKLGSIAVTTDPAGIPFVVTGPDGIILDGTTPAAFPNQPEGQYKVQFQPPAGCGNPPPKGDVLTSNGRISFTMTLSCKAADALRARQESQNAGGKFVQMTVGGIAVTLRDVPTDAWFGVYVAAVTKAGIMGGYRDAAGNPSGEFGPGNPVTIAELARIALNASGLTEIPGIRSGNPLAQEGWFTSVMASAEERGWRLYADATVDPARPATRAEVLVTLLQALDVPVEWQKGNIFADVTVKTPFASVIETAARDGVVSGKDDGSGRKMFYPADNINRAELAKMVTDMQKTYRAKAAASSSSAR